MSVTGSKFRNNYSRAREAHRKAWARNDEVWKKRRSRAIKKTQHIGTQLVNSVLNINNQSNQLQTLHLMRTRLYNPQGGYDTPSTVAMRVNMQV